jgi:aminopeptidase
MKKIRKEQSSYQPPAKILRKYAQILVNYALNSGEGVHAGEIVQCMVPDIAKPLALELQNEILRAGAHPMLYLTATGFEKDFYRLANQEQLEFFPRSFLRARAHLINHQISIIADPDPFILKEIDPSKIMRARNSKKPYRDWLNFKENLNQFTWTIALWGTAAKAEIVGLSLKEYWQQIIKACFLDEDDPIAKWRSIQTLQLDIKEKLNNLKISSVKVLGPDVDLKIGIGEDRCWKGGSGRNIPSFEIFTSPNWREVEGWIHFNQPLYRYGNLIENVELEIKAGRVIKARAKSGEHLLLEMLKHKNADKIGEFSLTDKRMSRITHVMAETLFDENIGGPYGNMHLALGMAYQDCYRGDPSQLKKRDWATRGFNDSSEHSDIVSTTDRTVTAFLTNGQSKIIYRQGQFLL